MKNKMSDMKMKKVIFQMGLPMIISMVLQALYNIVDTAFVINMGSDGINANLALTYAFPIQILMIAVGVGTGIGINALISKCLGEGNKEKASKVAGNGIFLAIVIYLIFLCIGLFFSETIISCQANGNIEAISMGKKYLTIVCTLSFGSIGYTVYERFLQSTGKTMFSTISQIVGALANIVLDYIFIYPLNMGVEGAAYATIIGQVLSLIVAMVLHYTLNKEITKDYKYIKPNKEIIKTIYIIGLPAMIMQAMLSVMMFGMNMILANSSYDSLLLQGSFGIYYKVQQLALFACFGLSNALITIISFNYGMKNRKRVKEGVKYGIIASLIVSFVILLVFFIFASSIASLFGMASGNSSSTIVSTTAKAIRIACLGYVFMGVTVAIQGIMQGLRYSIRPLILSLLRLIVFVLPIAHLFTLNSNAKDILWLAFPISEGLTLIVAVIMIIKCKRRTIDTITIVKETSDNLIICIARMHGTLGKEIGRVLADKLNINFYDKELSSRAAIKYGYDSKYLEDLTEKNMGIYNLYLSLDVNQNAIIAQSEIIKALAMDKPCVIVGRGADYILKDFPNMISVFIKAPLETRIQNVCSVYKDDKKDALKHIESSDKARGIYYEKITGKKWCDFSNYDLVIDTKGIDSTVEEILNFTYKKNLKIVK